MFLKMKVFGLTIDPFTNVPIVILKDDEEKNALPVWIGVLEASAIASELEKVQFTRPMTHDLLRDVLKQVGAIVNKVEVTDLKDNVYYATIHMTGREGEFTIDSRPSDAIALALRTNAPIFVESGVLDKSKSMELKGEGKDTMKDASASLEDIPMGDFGKYKM
ncbi:MAG: bifunctional nuclease family protein [Deltaproteobacteria bacterium]|nr:bifunctional nuclease family protein [Deltaproteobacteria bacterium]MBZ0219057.1 bifunctional nuclease family protein [Deltaproteobacteria bacterium]